MQRHSRPPSRVRRHPALGAAAAALALGLGGAASAQISGDVVKIGFITDMTGVLSDTDGPGGVEAMRMAVADFGAMVAGKRIEVLSADHQNKADIAASTAREWIDRQGVDMLIAGTNSSAALAISKIASDKKRPMFVIAAGSARLTNEECAPFTIHYAYDTVSTSRVMGSEIVKLGGKSWYFLTADYAFGKSLEADATNVVTQLGGTVVGASRFPLGASDFSSFLLQAQASRAKILALATSGDDTKNSVKAANEFGVSRQMNLAGLTMFIHDVHALTVPVTKGMYVTESWYWDQDEASRKWARRYFEKMKKMPSSLQAANYSATLQYLNAVKATGTDDATRVMAWLKSAKLNDMYVKGGWVRADGRMMKEQHLYQVKPLEESKYAWDYYKPVRTVPAEQAFTTKAESACPLWK
jgi:branched-chain amino acid transport system substrate-binding protein